MSASERAVLPHGQNHHHIEVADAALAFRSVPIADLTPTGSQLASAAGFKPVQQATVMQMLPDGTLEEIHPDRTVDLRHIEGRFVVVETDRIYLMTIDGERFDWPGRIVSGALIRRLGRISPEKSVYLERQEEPDREISPQDLIDLDRGGIEAFVSKTPHWRLNVQGVQLDLDSPTIIVREAIARAGFNPDQGWLVFLKVVGAPKRSVTLGESIDLRTPGIEKLRLTPDQVYNGEAPPAPRRDFALLDADHVHLARLGLRWETIVETGRRWLVLHDYPVPGGYTVERTRLALEIPPAYPHGQVYGFYAFPPLALASGRTIENTQLRGVIYGREFHGWSRYRGQPSWDPMRDNVASQLMLTDAALIREVGE